jgi:hypothetical protein
MKSSCSFLLIRRGRGRGCARRVGVCPGASASISFYVHFGRYDEQSVEGERGQGGMH